MSGGRYDYIQYNLEDVAEKLADKNNTPLQRAFAKHLYLVANAIEQIDLVKSCDKSEGDEVEAIAAVLGSTKFHEYEILEEDAKQLMKDFKRLFPKEFNNEQAK